MATEQVMQVRQVRPRWLGLLNLVLIFAVSLWMSFQGSAFSWITAALFAGVFVTEGAQYLGRGASKIVGWLSVAVALSVVSIRLLYWYAEHGQPRWVIALLLFAGAFPLRSALMRWAKPRGAEEAHRARQIIVHWGFSLLLFILFLFLRPAVPTLQAVILLFSAQFFWHGASLFNPGGELSETYRGAMGLILTAVLMASLSSTFQISLNPLFHVLVAVIVADSIALVFNTSLKPDKSQVSPIQDHIFIGATLASNFLRALQSSYQTLIANVQVWGIAAVVAFDLPARMVRSTMQGNVFEASLSLIALLIGFAFYLKDRKSSRSIMNGLWGLMLVFLIIAGVAFLTLALTSENAVLDQLPNLDTITVIDIFTRNDTGFGALILFLYEALFYAVLMGLVFIGVVIRGMLRHNQEEDEQQIHLP